MDSVNSHPQSHAGQSHFPQRVAIGVAQTWACDGHAPATLPTFSAAAAPDMCTVAAAAVASSSSSDVRGAIETCAPARAQGAVSQTLLSAVLAAETYGVVLAAETYGVLSAFKNFYIKI